MTTSLTSQGECSRPMESQAEDFRDAFELNQFFGSLSRRKSLLLLGPLLCVSAMALANKFIFKNVYTAAATILIEKTDSGSPDSGESVSVESRGQDYYETQYGILRSYSLA